MTIYAIVAVIVVVLVVGVAGVLLLGNNNGNNETTPTPTPPPATVVGASTVEFYVNQTTSGATVTYHYLAKNFNSSTEVIRLDILGGAAGNYSYVLNAGQQKSWSGLNGAGYTQDASFNAQFVTDFTNYTQKLADQGNINDVTYTSGSDTITIYCAVVNQSIPDSTFATS